MLGNGLGCLGLDVDPGLDCCFWAQSGYSRVSGVCVFRWRLRLSCRHQLPFGAVSFEQTSLRRDQPNRCLADCGIGVRVPCMSAALRLGQRGLRSDLRYGFLPVGGPAPGSGRPRCSPERLTGPPMKALNKPQPANPAIAGWLHAGRRWRGAAAAERWGLWTRT
jgi:hypothetical protein